MTELEPSNRSPIVIRPAEVTPVAYADIDFTISRETAEDLLRAVPQNTKLAYDRNWGAFEEWCDSEGRVPLPATPHTLTEYVSRLCGIGFAPATISQVIGTIRSIHRKNGYKGEPDTEETLGKLKLYKRDWADDGNRVRKATPILVDTLRAMVDTCDPTTLSGARDRALLLLGFNMMARRSEAVGLDLRDLQAGPDGLTAYIKYSKTDQAAEGVSVPVPYGQHEETCAVRAVEAWRAVLLDRGITSGAVFRPIDRHGRIGDQEGAAGRIADRLSGRSASDIVHRRGVLAGKAESYTFHGLRSGAATSAYAAGMPVASIALHGRWIPTSPVVLGYFRAVDKWKNNPMKGIGL